jgi:hypothetical protein
LNQDGTDGIHFLVSCSAAERRARLTRPGHAPASLPGCSDSMQNSYPMLGHIEPARLPREPNHRARSGSRKNFRKIIFLL